NLQPKDTGDTIFAALKNHNTLKIFLIEDQYYPTEVLYKISTLSLPPHCLMLKKEAIVMLLRNLDISSGPCNGTQLRKVGQWIPTDVIYHGQLYVALSSVVSRQGLIVQTSNRKTMLLLAKYYKKIITCLKFLLLLLF